MEGRARPRDLGLAGRRAAELALELETVVTTGELMLDVVAVLVMQVLTVACRIPDGFNPTFNWKKSTNHCFKSNHCPTSYFLFNLYISNIFIVNH